MMKRQIKIGLFIFFGCFQTAYSQQLITLQTAIDSALYNNLGLIIVRNEAAIADNNATKANAGMLPRVDLNAGTNYANNNLNQKLSTGVEINKSGVSNKSFNGQLAVSWTLFDGTKMFATYQKQQILRDMGDLNVQIKTEEIISTIIRAYSEIVRQSIVLKGTVQNISLYEERVKLAEMKLRIGKSSRTEFLQASLDLNLQKSNLVKQTTLLKNAKLNLSRLMMLPLNSEFETTDSLVIDKTILLPKLLADLENGNKQLQLLHMDELKRTQEIKEQESFYYPRVNLNAGYNFVSSSSSQGLFLINQNRGPLVGLTLNWTLYNGTQRNQVENVKLLRENTKLVYDDTKIALQTMVIAAWQNYQDAIELAKTEEESYKMADENLTIMLKRFKLGEATILELKDAQQVNEASTSRLANTLYDAKTAETELLYLTGKLIK
jgi:outer membrane protein TolC